MRVLKRPGRPRWFRAAWLPMAAVLMAGCGDGDFLARADALEARAGGGPARPAAERDAAGRPAQAEADAAPELSGIPPPAGAAGPGAGERPAPAGDASVPGEVALPHPTLRNLSIEWAVQGDADLDGGVAVRFRREGEAGWRRGMALRRVPAGLEGGERHSGSLLDLAPDTAYEIELTLTDPDGGSAVRTVRARTRALPGPMAGAPVRRVTPSSFARVAAKARPGDILQLGAGTYPGLRFERSGRPGHPIVIRSDAGAVINGDVELLDVEHVHLSGLTVHGGLRLDRTRHVAVTRNTVHAREDGIVQSPGSQDGYIADNLVLGGTPWAESSLGEPGGGAGGHGIRVAGPGHVVAHNRVSGFRDAIALLSGPEAADPFSIDVIGNDLRNASGDAVDIGHCRHNCRVMRNRVTNAFAGLSAQPTLGGPVYFVRNALYNVVHAPFRLHGGGAGDLVLHNTVVKGGDTLALYSGRPARPAVFRNNLFIGGPGDRYAGRHEGAGLLLSIARLELDGAGLEHNAYGSIAEEFRGRIGWEAFSSVAALHDTLKDKRAVKVALDSFAAPVEMPAEPMREHAPPDLRLAPASPARDAGVRIPNVNDDHEGAAPDIGALELGRPLPAYGPRPAPRRG